jgi:hypothetical protein
MPARWKIICQSSQWLKYGIKFRKFKLNNINFLGTKTTDMVQKVTGLKEDNANYRKPYTTGL